jgi:transglutaminase-like putative cysteine protease
MLRKTKPALCLAIGFATLLLYALPGFANAPDWVQQAAAKAPGNYPAEANAVVLLDEESLTVTGPGQAEVDHRRVVRILRPKGHREALFRVNLSPGDKMQYLHAWTIDSSGRQYEVKEKEFADESPYAEEMYSDVHYRVADAPAGNPGSVVAFEYSVRRQLWMNRWSWFFQEDIPVDEARLTVQLPNGWEYKDNWANHPLQKAAQVGPNRWQWVCQNMAGIPEEKHSPGMDALAAHMEIAFFDPAAGSNLGSWKAIGDWYYKLTAGRRDPSPEIAAKARQLTANAATFDAKLQALAGFLQSEVRYVAIEIGIGGYQPHPAPDIYRMRYGDCKDKATLLSAMLKEVGISSDYVLVDTERGVVKPEVPATLFNHVILAIAIPANTPAKQYLSVVKTSSGATYLIFDPTDEYTPVGELRSGLQGTYGLLAAPSGGELIKLPVEAPDTNRLDRQGKFSLQVDGSITGTVTDRLTGTHAARQRANLVHENESERAKSFDHYLAGSLKNASVQQLKFAEVGARDKDLTVEYQMVAPGYAQRSGSLVLLRTRVLGEKGIEVDWGKRKLPIQLAGATQEKDIFEIQLPPGYAVDDLPEPKQVDVGFASYRSKIESSGSIIRYTREYVVTDPYIGMEKLADLHKLENAIYDDELATAVLKKTQ